MEARSLPQRTLSNSSTFSLLHRTESQKNRDALRKIPNSQLCIVGPRLRGDPEFIQAAESLELAIHYSDTGQEFVDNRGTVYVLEEFTGENFERLYKSGHRIIGPPALLYHADNAESLPQNSRPLFNQSMKDLILCFNGFKKKESLDDQDQRRKRRRKSLGRVDFFRKKPRWSTPCPPKSHFRLENKMVQLVTLIHHMGGLIRKDFSSTKITHLVSNSISGENYRYAASIGIPVMKEDWIYDLWARRNDRTIHAADEEFKKYRLPPLFSCTIAIYGFGEEERAHMEDLATQNGGRIVTFPSDDCTHLVVDNNTKVDFNTVSCNTHVVRSEWFWASILIMACADESIYLIQRPYGSTPQSRPRISRGHKRKRLAEVVHQLAQVDSGGSDSDLTPDPRGALSISASLLDATLSPDNSITAAPPIPSVDLSKASPRHQVAIELFQTETNYVGILSTIMMLFQEARELPNLLESTDLKTIFGNVPPIYEVHCRLKHDLAQLLCHWREESSVGNVFLRHSQELQRAYPPFVNFFESTKESLVHFDQTRPRFHAFLKQCESKPECGRQTLVELLIRPVQRLPSIILLLNDLLKHTPKTNPDLEALEQAIRELKEVMTYINEDKRKTEGQLVMFDIVNDIENCPAQLLSSHRSFVTKVDVLEARDTLSHRGDPIALFLFSDTLEMCKRRSKAAANAKSPGNFPHNGTKTRHKSYKHLELVPLAHIKRVVDIVETDECQNAFALVVRSHLDVTERLYTFVLQQQPQQPAKSQFLAVLCRNMANTICRTDAETLLTTLEPTEFELDTTDLAAVTTSTFNRAMKLAHKTKRKINRALTIKKTPNKGLTRSGSQFVSPLRLFNSPASQSSLRLTSTSSLEPFSSPFISTPKLKRFMSKTPTLSKKELRRTERMDM